MKKLLLFFLLLISFCFPYKGFSQTVTGQIGTGTGTNNFLPIYTYYSYNYTQQIYTAAEVNTAIGTAQYITNIRFLPTNLSTPQSDYNDWTIYIGNTTQLNFATTTSWVPLASLTQVYTGILPTMTNNNWVDIQLDNPFLWDGTSNLVIAVDENSPNWATAVPWRSYNAGANRGIRYYSDGTNPNPATPPTANGRESSIPQIQLVGTTPQACNSIPQGLSTTNITATTATLNWNPAYGGSYVLEWRELPGGTWNTVTPNLTTNSYTLTGLSDETDYEWRVSYDCSGVIGTASATEQFTTPLVSWCQQQATSPLNLYGYVSNVTVIPDGAVAVSNTSGHSGYSDYSTDPSKIITLVRGSTDNEITITKSWPGNNFNNNVKVWIDFNRDGDFDDVGEEILTNGPSNATPLSDTFNVGLPPDVYGGNKLSRMRVALSSVNPQLCTSFPLGEIEDYGVRFIDLPACTVAPPDPIVVVNLQPSSAYVTWTGATGATYIVRYREVGSATWTEASTASSGFLINTLAENTNYEVQVATICGGSTSNFSPWIPFTTPDLTYCTPSTNPNSTNEWISNVTITPNPTFVPAFPMSSTSTGSGYIDYAGDASRLVTLVIGSTGNDISVAKDWAGAPSDVSVVAWIDFNRNGVFETSEKILDEVPNQTTPVANVFDVPMSAYNGPSYTKMRVILRENVQSTNPCAGFAWGEIEDYDVKLNEEIPCSNNAPTNVLVSAITFNSATVTWDQDPGWANYLIRYKPVTQNNWTATLPVNAVTTPAPSTNSYNLINLDPSTQYIVEVIATCDNVPGNATQVTFETECNPAPPSGLTVTNITTTSALVSWDPIPNATYVLEYQEVGTGAWTTVNLNTNSYTITGLNPYTNYEVRVASVCSGAQNPFTTPKVFKTEPTCEMAPQELTVTNITMTSAQVDWNEIPGATYILRYREVGFTTWTEFPVSTNTYIITGLQEQTQYELQVANVCNGATQQFTNIYTFMTPGVVYCDMESRNSNNFISNVNVKPSGLGNDYEMDNASGASNYTSYVDNQAKVVYLAQGSTGNRITVEKNLSSSDIAAVTVWMDFNRDGKFDIHERILTYDPSDSDEESASFNVPANAYVSLVEDKYFVMRVALSRDVAPAMCATIEDGEVEDYKVRIIKPFVADLVQGITVYPNPTKDVLNIRTVDDGATYTIYSSIGRVVQSGLIVGSKVDVKNLINGVYIINIDNKGKEEAQIKFIKE